ncbi:MAG: thioesterase family protein [Desulfobacterales bacterium]|jgi:acyl-CoA thioesterase FadM|nr:thioesterase family protein [Desulfobacterales bacterium]
MIVSSNAPHKTKMIIPFSDVDMSGIVYTARLVDYMLKGWEDYFRCIGIPWQSFVGGPVFRGLPVIDLNTKFLSPGYLGDEIEIETLISKIDRRRIFFKFSLKNLSTGRAMATAGMTTAAIGMDFKSCLIPDFILTAITGK